jgi:CheY-like chemotaxis protein
MTSSKKRILIIDDSEAIHQDFRRILCPEQKTSSGELDQMADMLFGPSPASARAEMEFEVESAFQGQEGLARVEQAQVTGCPYELVFLDYRMPPGWSGVETLRHLRKVSATLPVVLCSAYSDYSWEEIAREFSEGLAPLELRKPFNSQELRKLATHLTARSGG